MSGSGPLRNRSGWPPRWHKVRVVEPGLCGEATVKLLALHHENRLREREALAQTGRDPTVEALARSRE